MYIINPYVYSVGAVGATEFKFTVDTTKAGSASDTFILSLWLGTTNMTVYWGDGNSDVITSYNQAELTHVYASSGTYQISCDGAFVGTNYYGGDKLKIMSIDNWGSNAWSKAIYAFSGCSNMVANYTDIPNTSNVTTMEDMFRDCTNFNGTVGFDTSSVTTMVSMFSGCTSFNQSVNFTTPLISDTSGMFSGCSTLNSSITFSNTSNVTNMASMFRTCLAFNQPLSFNTSSVIFFYQTFFGCTNFNQDVSGFNISSLTNASGMLQGSAFSTTNYDLLLVAWQGQTHNNTVTFHAGTAKYSAGASATARAALITDAWTITDGGPV